LAESRGSFGKLGSGPTKKRTKESLLGPKPLKETLIMGPQDLGPPAGGPGKTRSRNPYAGRQMWWGDTWCDNNNNDNDNDNDSDNDNDNDNDDNDNDIDNDNDDDSDNNNDNDTDIDNDNRHDNGG